MPRIPRIVVHYHIYKTAGSTILYGVRNFVGERHCIDLDTHPEHKLLRRNKKAYDRAFFERVVPENPEVIFYSAHFVIPDVHFSTEIDISPIVFVRHPLLRAASVYRFERSRPGDEERDMARNMEGHNTARSMDMSEWIEASIESENGVECRNTQSCFLSSGGKRFPLSAAAAQNVKAGPPQRDITDFAAPLTRWVRRGNLPLVLRRLDAIRVVGVVEQFDASVRRISVAMQRKFPNFQMNVERRNVTKAVTDWRAELRDVERGLSKASLDHFYEANTDDLMMWERYYGALSAPLRKRPARVAAPAQPDGVAPSVTASP